ncbi:vitamin K epoxide reductase family protein [Pyxidicoccus sp. 3LFB2]
MDVDAIRQELREGRSPSLTRRRRVAKLAAVGLADFAVISLYQLGAVKRLPDLPGKWWDSNGVNAARTAYALGVPDGPLGAIHYGVTLALAAVGGSRRTGRSRVWDVLLGGAVLGGAGAALYYLWDMAFKERRACAYCLVGAALNLGMVPLLWPEWREARHA